MVFNPDATLIAEREALVVSADSAVLDRCAGWFNLGRLVVTRHVPEAVAVDLADAETV